MKNVIVLLLVSCSLVACQKRKSGGGDPSAVIQPAGRPAPYMNTPEYKAADREAHAATPSESAAASTPNETIEVQNIQERTEEVIPAPAPTTPIVPVVPVVSVTVTTLTQELPLTPSEDIQCKETDGKFNDTYECQREYTFCHQGIDANNIPSGAVGMSCSRVREAKLEGFKCEPRVLQNGKVIPRYLSKAACLIENPDGCLPHFVDMPVGMSSEIQYLYKFQENTKYYLKTDAVPTCWERSPVLKDDPNNPCKSNYDYQTDTVEESYISQDICLQKHTLGCQETPAYANEGYVCWKGVFPAIDRALLPGYSHPTLISRTEVTTGFQSAAYKWKIDSLSCKDGSVRLHTNDFHSCETGQMNPAFHQDFLPLLWACVQHIVPNSGPDDLVHVEHWSLFFNKQNTKNKAELSQHAYGLAIDLHAVRFKERVYNFEAAKDALTDGFQKYIDQHTPAEQTSFSEAEVLALQDAYYKEVQNTEWFTFWDPLMGCLSNGGIGAMQFNASFASIAGTLPQLVELPDGNYSKKVLRHKNKTIEHDNHVHIELPKE